jgi:hypothetical protein
MTLLITLASNATGTHAARHRTQPRRALTDIQSLCENFGRHCRRAGPERHAPSQVNVGVVEEILRKHLGPLTLHSRQRADRHQCTCESATCS